MIENENTLELRGESQNEGFFSFHPCLVKVVSHWPTLSPDRLADGRAFTYGGSDGIHQLTKHRIS
jgi:hypothetical protein